MNYELFQQEPSLFFSLLLISLVVTILAYGAFPFIFAKTRKKPITKKKYKLCCYGINFAVMIVFMLMNGGVSSGAPYLFWTWIFSKSGVKSLNSRGMITVADNHGQDDALGEGTSAGEWRIRFCRKCGEELMEGSRFCRKCGAEITEVVNNSEMQ